MRIFTETAKTLLTGTLTRVLILSASGFLCLVSPVIAEQSTFYRSEPIFPIPRLVVYDIAKAELGEKLFSDTRLSSNGQLSCASCHQLDAGGDDNLPIGLSGGADQHVINTPTIFNAQFNFRQNWDGAVKTLEEQINRAVSGIHGFNSSWSMIASRLNEDNELRDAFTDIYPEGINKTSITEVLVAFEKSLYTPDAPFDRYLRNEENSLTTEEIDGYGLFKERGCISCHQGINIGGNLYQKFGVFYNYFAERGNLTRADYGRKNITQRDADAFVFKVPSLRNIAVTAPYLHDGSAETLEEVIDIMGKTQLGRTLSKEDIRLIEGFLRTLTGRYNGNSLDDNS